MKADFELRLADKAYDTDWFRSHFPNCSPRDFDENEFAVLNFCSEWLSGKPHFSVQTSGSTGKPRPILLSRQQMINSAKLTRRALGLKSGDHALLCLSPAHIAGKMMLVRALEIGLAITAVTAGRNPFDSYPPEEVPCFDFAAFVPLQLRTIIERGGVGLERVDAMKAVLVGGAELPAGFDDLLQELQAPLYQTFGMTETSTHIALRRLNGAAASDSYKVLPGITVARDARGCLTIKGSVTDDRTVVTNDVVEFEADGSFRWRGRFDNVINSGGIKVQAEHVEQVIAEVLQEVSTKFATAEFFVAGVPAPDVGEQVAVFFETDELSVSDTDHLRDLLSNRLSRYEIPRLFRSTRRFSRTPTAKLDRKATISAVLCDD